VTVGFVCGRMPRLDARLRERYTEAFRERERYDRRFVPLLY
jgi:hypothetical protein